MTRGHLGGGNPAFQRSCTEREILMCFILGIFRGGILQAILDFLWDLGRFGWASGRLRQVPEIKKTCRCY